MPTRAQTQEDAKPNSLYNIDVCRQTIIWTANSLTGQQKRHSHSLSPTYTSNLQLVVPVI